MPADRPLTLPEEVLLLALRDEEGTIAGGSLYAYGIGGAALAELILHRRVKLESSGKKRLVGVADAKPTGDPFLDDCLTRIVRAEKRATADTWVARFANTKRLRDRLALGLCARGILEADEEKLLLLFTRKIYPEVDPAPEAAIVERLRRAILGHEDDLDTRTVVLVSLANSTGLLTNVFDKKVLNSRQDRIDRIVNGDATGEATQEAIEAIKAAMFIAVVLPTIITTTTTT